MAADLQDYSSAVVIQSGSVSITGIATVSISGTPNVAISGTPTVILGGGSATIGSISAIGSTVTVAGTINIGNTPAVTISGTPSVTISSGTVTATISGTASVSIASSSVTLNVAVTGTPAVTISGTPSVSISGPVSISGTVPVSISGTPAVTISGTPTVNIGTVSGTVTITGSVSISAGTVTISGTPIINIQSANGVQIAGPNIFPAAASGPFTGGWTTGVGAPTIAYNSDGFMLTTLTVAGNSYIQAFDVAGPYAMPRVRPGETYRVTMTIKQNTRANTLFMEVHGFSATGAGGVVIASASITPTLGVYTTLSADIVVPEEKYLLGPLLYVALGGAPQIGDTTTISRLSIQNLGALPVNAQQGVLPVSSAANPVTTLTAAAASGQAIFTPLNQAIFSPGDMVTFVSLTGGPSATGFVKSVNTNGTVTLTTNLTSAFALGDAVLIVTLINVSGPPLATAIRKRGWDAHGTNTTGSGFRASVVFAGVANKSWQCDQVAFTMVNIALAAAQQMSMDVLDGVTVVWSEILSTTGTFGQVDRVFHAEMGLQITFGAALTVQGSAGIVNIGQSVSAGAYQRDSVDVF